MDLRERLFDIYAANLSDMEPGTKETFRCPMCLKDFDRSALQIDQKLTLGHIIPEAVGGRIRTLECGKCNHTIGGTYDAHVDHMKKLIDWAHRKDGTKRLIRLKEDDSDTAAILSWEKGPIAAIKATNRGDPNYRTAINQLGPRIENGKFSFTISVKSLSSREWRTLSAVHSAFLMMFYCFGYEYILSPEADIIRKIIRDGKAPWDIGKMETYMPIIPDHSAPAAGVLRKPKEMKSFVVILPCFYAEGYFQIIFLPGLQGEKTFQNLINSRKKNAGKINFSISTIDNGPLPKGLCRSIWDGTLHA